MNLQNSLEIRVVEEAVILVELAVQGRHVLPQPLIFKFLFSLLLYPPLLPSD